MKTGEDKFANQFRGSSYSINWPNGLNKKGAGLNVYIYKNVCMYIYHTCIYIIKES